MSFQDIFQEVKESFTREGIFSASISEKIFDIIAYYFSPFFLKLKISANTITGLGLILSILSAGAFIFGKLIAGLLLYAGAILCDHIDGRVARATHNATYFGRFYDGLVNIFTFCLIRIGLIYFIFNRYGFSSLILIGLVNISLIPCYHFIFDRYSTFARWINEEKRIQVMPYIRKGVIVKISSIAEDTERLSLILCPLFFLPAMRIYFIVGIIVSLTNILYHLYQAFINMRVSNYDGRKVL